MHHFIHHKTAIAAALLIATGLAGAQTAPENTPPSTPGMMNSTTSPNPLQKPSSDGAPSSATGEQTPGTGTGSSRTMRNPTPAADSMVNGSPSTTTMPSSDMKNEPMATPMATPAPMTTPAPMARPARRDRG